MRFTTRTRQAWHIHSDYGDAGLTICSQSRACMSQTPHTAGTPVLRRVVATFGWLLAPLTTRNTTRKTTTRWWESPLYRPCHRRRTHGEAPGEPGASPYFRVYVCQGYASRIRYAPGKWQAAR